LIGMLALAGALAFGLGGRDVAARLLEDAYQRGQAAREQAAQDVQTGKERAKDQAGQAYPDEEAPPRRTRKTSEPAARRRTSTRR
jgi:hypothetical protein